MSSKIIAKLISKIEDNWDDIEKILYYPAQSTEFKNYLNQYRGFKIDKANSKNLVDCAQQDLFQYFINLFELEKINQLDHETILKILSSVEKSLNLSLYYWFGLNDRNFQFRTWIHFFDLEKKNHLLFSKDNNHYYIQLSEHGIYLGLKENFQLPQIFPISKIFQLEYLDEREYFAQLRSLQKEICLLVDEWEYQNSILAVEYVNTLKLLQTEKNDENEISHQSTLKKMDHLRNYYAQFNLESLCDFQEWINSTFEKITNTDILAEIDALCCLMLAAYQKLFLPASMSRLVYKNEVITLFQRFIVARLKYNPDDYSAALVCQATQSALGEEMNPDIFRIMNSKPFEWKLCFDPSTALKSFCWSYSKEHHLILTSLMGLCYFKKCYLNQLDDHQLVDLANTYQIQDSFLSFLNRQPVHNCPSPINQEKIVELKNNLINCFSTRLKKTHQHSYELEIIQQYLGFL